MMMSSYDARGSAPIVVQEDYKLAAAFTAIGVLSLAVPLFKVLPSLVCVTAGLGPLLSVEPGTGRSIEWQDYKGNLACALFGLLTLVPALGGAVWGGFCTVFGLFLAFQTYRVRFVFEDGAISVQNASCRCSARTSRSATTRSSARARTSPSAARTSGRARRS